MLTNSILFKVLLISALNLGYGNVADNSSMQNNFIVHFV